MKKQSVLAMILLLALGMTSFAGCGSKTEDPGPPPSEVINPDNTQSENDGSAYDGTVLENAVSVRIGQGESKDWSIDMYNNDAAVTMLGYLSGSPLLFPTYTYEEGEGFVAQSVRGTYSRDNEVTVSDVKAGELYLFSGNQLRFYFKNVDGANITATPIGYYTDTEGLTDAVIDAYQSNLGDIWGVDVYFVITKTMD